MMTILPQNSILSKANSVTVDAEKFAKLNGINDEKLREALGTALAKLVNSYNNHVINIQDYTVGQALEVVKMTAEEIRAFTGVETEEEYVPEHFEPDDSIAGAAAEPAEPDETPRSAPARPVLTANDRRKMLFNSFNRKH